MVSIADLGLGAGFGCIAGIALGAYLKGMFEESGKIDAAISRLEDVGRKAFKEAFEGEAGKRLASHQDLTNVLDELRKVTTETESIRAQISGDAWLKQTVWGQKRESYASLLRSLESLQKAATDFAGAFAVLEQHIQEPESETQHKRRGEYLSANDRFLDSLVQMSLRFAEASLFDPQVVERQKSFRENYGLEAASTRNATSADIKQFALGLFKFRRELLKHMQAQLGIHEVAAKFGVIITEPNSGDAGRR